MNLMVRELKEKESPIYHPWAAVLVALQHGEQVGEHIGIILQKQDESGRNKRFTLAALLAADGGDL